jgi:hypothetical protein
LAQSVEEIKVYPNPASAYIKLEANVEDLPLQLHIVNAAGNSVFRLTLENPLQEVNISSLPEGLYYIHGQGKSYYQARFRKL